MLVGKEWKGRLGHVEQLIQQRFGLRRQHHISEYATATRTYMCRPTAVLQRVLWSVRLAQQ